MSDVRQQFDFFMTLGQHEQAIAVLAARVAQCGESDPLTCLDLLSTYHRLGKQAEFDFMRAEFHRWFTGHVPDFLAFGAEGRSLEHYPDVFRHIQIVWPEPRVLEFIEDCVYQDANAALAMTFDLNAYRDLLLLHGVAKWLVRDGMGESVRSDLIRMPARTQGMTADAGGNTVDSQAVRHRSGAEFRHAEGSYTPVPPQGGMRVPPVASTQTDADSPHPGLEVSSIQGSLTEFNFLKL